MPEEKDGSGDGHRPKSLVKYQQRDTAPVYTCKTTKSYRRINNYSVNASIRNHSWLLYDFQQSNGIFITSKKTADTLACMYMYVA